jgi:hypothetical protein
MYQLLTDSKIFRKLNVNGFLEILDFFINNLKFTSHYKNPFFKKFIDSMVPVDPLIELPNEKPGITVMIPCSSKDFPMLPTVIFAARSNIRNPILEIVVVTPDVDLVPKNLGPIKIMSDNHFLGQQKVKNLLTNLKLDSGWIKQQLIKILFCLQSAETNILVLDADTILTKPKLYVSGNMQILSFAYEYHSPYIQHLKRFLPFVHDFGLTFVTHHQLWQKDIVHDIWSGSGLKDWLHSMDKNELSPISEYNTYGLYMYNFHSERVRLSRFANEQFSRKLLENFDEDLEAACAKFPDSCSISIHSYS